MSTIPAPTVPKEPTNSAAAQAEVIARLAREGVHRHLPIDLNSWPEDAKCAPHLVWPDKSITNLEGALPRPLRKRGEAILETVDSFNAYLGDHATDRTVIFGDANEKGGEFKAILDYHDAEPDGTTGWAEHTARLIMRPTPEWVRWCGICQKDLEQRTFAEFIEDNAADVAVPDHDPKSPNSADLLQLATTLQIKTDVRFSSQIRLQNGQVQLTYDELINGTWGGAGNLEVPQAFWIGVVPFRGGQRYALRIRLRYRGSQGKATFRLEMERPHKVVEQAFNDTKHAIEEKQGEGAVLVGVVNPAKYPAY